MKEKLSKENQRQEEFRIRVEDHNKLVEKFLDNQQKLIERIVK